MCASARAWKPKDIPELNVETLRHAYETDPWVKVILDYFAKQPEVSKVTEARPFAENEINRPEREIVKMLMTLSSLGCGYYINGRHSKGSRLEWTYKANIIARIARGEDLKLERVGELNRAKPIVAQVAESFDPAPVVKQQAYQPQRAPQTIAAPQASRPAVSNTTKPPVYENNGPVELVVHTFHLRKGLVIELPLPADLRKEETGRIARYLETLVI